MKKILSLFLITVLLTGCMPTRPVNDAPTLQGFLLEEAIYPEMAPYPNEMNFVDPKTGIFDDEGFSVVYDAWRSNRDLRKDIPEGYADSLSYYFQSAIPVFLSDTERNAVCSPLNVYMALALLAECTDGESRQQIMNFVDCADMDALRLQAGQVWKAHYCADGASACTLANSLWLDSGLTYNPDTVSCLAKDHYASVFQCTLGSQDADRALRDWLNQQIARSGTGSISRPTVFWRNRPPVSLWILTPSWPWPPPFTTGRNGTANSARNETPRKSFILPAAM